jgi:hypothetical protein
MGLTPSARLDPVKKRTLPPGIRKTPFGFEAYVRVHNVLYTRRYPPAATIKEMREWVAITRGEKLTTSSPFRAEA